MAVSDPEATIPPDYHYKEEVTTKARRGSTTEITVYSTRWWVLGVFSLASFTQALVWNTWGPITESAEAVYGWHDSNIGMFANWGNIAYIIFVLPLCWFMDSKGLRISMLFCGVTMAIGTGLRCIPGNSTIVTWMATVCAFLNGIAGVVPFAGPALLASVWFPLSQRATATATASFFNYFGVSMAFILGPRLVPFPHHVNTTSVGISQYSEEIFSRFSEEIPMVQSIQDGLHNKSHNSSDSVDNLREMKDGISHLLYVHAGLAGLLLILSLVYFPDKPPTPPSISASIQRTNYTRGLSKLMRNGSVWLIVMAYSIPTGVLGVWASVLDVNVNPLGVNQIQAGWMGFWQTLAGCTAGLMIARFSDVFMRRMKLFLIVLFICAILSSAWFTVLCNKYIPFNYTSLYASCILIGVFVNGAIPLFYEISCEASYPVAEGVTGGFMTLVNNIFGIMFLFALLIPGIGHSWMNWCLLASTVIALPLLFLFPEQYRRTDIDIVIPPPSPTATDIQKVDESLETSPLLAGSEQE